MTCALIQIDNYKFGDPSYMFTGLLELFRILVLERTFIAHASFK